MSLQVIPFFLWLIMFYAPTSILAYSDPRSVPDQNFIALSEQNPQVAQTTGANVAGSGFGGYLGVFVGDLNEDLARELKLTEVRGVVIGKVEEASPAARAGLRENDVILSFRGQRVQNRAQLYRLIIEAVPGARENLKISREGQILDLVVELGRRQTGLIDDRQILFSEVDALLATAEDRRREAGELKQKGDEKGAQAMLEEEKLFRKQADERRTEIETQIREGKIQAPSTSRSPNYRINANRYYLGLTVVHLSEQLAVYFNVTNGGVLVSDVRAGGAAERAGIKAGDCIVAVNQDRVNSSSDLNRLIDKPNQDGVDLVITIVRERSEQKVKVRIEAK